MNVIKVISASALSEIDIKKIEKTFKQKHNGIAEFIYEIDTTILGGVLIVDGEKYYDATLKGQLASLRRSI